MTEPNQMQSVKDSGLTDLKEFLLKVDNAEAQESMPCWEESSEGPD